MSLLMEELAKIYLGSLLMYTMNYSTEDDDEEIINILDSIENEVDDESWKEVNRLTQHQLKKPWTR